ncbi:porin [Endozoicomonas atrinae]|uniref:porin n=1 Tax=Endozoicomonas atrinae TaxID=1333660 RepID=UPI003AFFAF9E
MQKKILAAVVASMMAGQAMAITVVDDGTNKVSIGGHIGMRYVDQTDGEATGDSSRINFAFENKLTESTTAFAKAEWGFSTVSTGSDGDFFWQRLGYVGAKNDQLGALSFGKQWSSYYMISGWTDMFATTGGEASGTYTTYGEELGTARADDALQYNHSFMGLNVSAQVQLGEREMYDNAVAPTPATDHVERSSSYGIAASYDLPMGLSFGAAYNQAELKSAKGEIDLEGKGKAKSAIVGAKFEADKIYAALTFAKMKNVDQGGIFEAAGVVEKAEGIELFASYQLNDMFTVGGGYNQLKDKSNTADIKGKMKYYPVEVVYTQGPVQLSGTYQFEDSKKAVTGEKVEDKIILQARYYF